MLLPSMLNATMPMTNICAIFKNCFLRIWKYYYFPFKNQIPYCAGKMTWVFRILASDSMTPDLENVGMPR